MLEGFLTALPDCNVLRIALCGFKQAHQGVSLELKIHVADQEKFGLGTIQVGVVAAAKAYIGTLLNLETMKMMTKLLT